MIIGIDVGLTGAWALLSEIGTPTFSRSLPAMTTQERAELIDDRDPQPAYPRA